MSRWFFRLYALLVGLAGIVIFGWGPMWMGTDLPGQPFGKAALIRVFGSIMVAFACWAASYSTHGIVNFRGALFWFMAAHFVVFNAARIQQRAIWGPGIGESAVQAVGIVAFLVWILYTYDVVEEETSCGRLTRFLGGTDPRQDLAQQLRSQYEMKIRAAARQEERNRLARDLHDSIKQQIFVIQTAAATAQARFESDSRGASLAIGQVRDAARDAMTEMQVMLDQLRAEPLENAGLIESLKKQCEALSFRTGATVDFQLGSMPPNEALEPGVHEAFQRVAQEALANVGRHARAANVQVSLGSANGQLQLQIQDDGAGFDANQPVHGQGLGNMRARAQELHGTFELTTSPDRGTAVTFRVPYSVENPKAMSRNVAIVAAAVAFSGVILFTYQKTFGIAVILMTAAISGLRLLASLYVARRARQEAK